MIYIERNAETDLVAWKDDPKRKTELAVVFELTRSVNGKYLRKVLKLLGKIELFGLDIGVAFFGEVR
jgi:hypothetical protein